MAPGQTRERAALGHRRRPSSCCCTAAGRTRTRGTRWRSRSTGRCSRSTCRVTVTRTGAPTTRTSRPRTPSAVAVVIRALAPNAAAVVGMSLGGLTALALATEAPELVRKLRARRRHARRRPRQGVRRSSRSSPGPQSFASFDEILERTVQFNPTRSESSLRRGILHNAAERPDGTWAWRYERFEIPEGAEMPDFGDLWELRRRGARPVAARARRRLAGRERRRRRRAAPSSTRRRGSWSSRRAGHSVQGDQPLELARLIEEHARRVVTRCHGCSVGQSPWTFVGIRGRCTVRPTRCVAARLHKSDCSPRVIAVRGRRR